MSTTPHNHVLIDYENVQSELASRLAPDLFKGWVFVGALQSKVKFDLVELLQAKSGDAKVIKMGGTGTDAHSGCIALSQVIDCLTGCSEQEAKY